MKDNGIRPEHTIRYTPEWDDDLGGSIADGGLRIDLGQDGEVIERNASDDTDDTDVDDGAAPTNNIGPAHIHSHSGLVLPSDTAAVRSVAPFPPAAVDHSLPTF